MRNEKVSRRKILASLAGMGLVVINPKKGLAGEKETYWENLYVGQRRPLRNPKFSWEDISKKFQVNHTDNPYFEHPYIIIKYNGMLGKTQVITPVEEVFVNGEERRIELSPIFWPTSAEGYPPLDIDDYCLYDANGRVFPVDFKLRIKKASPEEITIGVESLVRSYYKK